MARFSRLKNSYALVALRYVLAFLCIGTGRVSADVGIYSADSPAGAVVAEEISNELPQAKRIADAASLNNPKLSTLVVLGADALSKIPDTFTGRIVASFLTEQEFLQFRQQHPTLKATAIYSSSSPTAQINLAKALLSGPRIGLIYGSQTPDQVVNSYQSVAKKVGLQIFSARCESDDVLKTVRRMISMDRIDVLLVVDEPQLYPNEVLVPTLRLLLRYNKSAIAFAPGIVRAGAIGATYFDRPAIYSSVAKAAGELEAGHGHMPEPGYPEHASYSVNKQYLRSVYDVLYVDEIKLEEAINGAH